MVIFCVSSNRCGKIEGVRILPGKFCAFVEFSSPDETALALDIMQVCKRHISAL